MSEQASPAEVAARAHWEAERRPFPEFFPAWEELPEDSRRDSIEKMTLALLAIEDAGLASVSALDDLLTMPGRLTITRRITGRDWWVSVQNDATGFARSVSAGTALEALVAVKALADKP